MNELQNWKSLAIGVLACLGTAGIVACNSNTGGGTVGGTTDGTGDGTDGGATDGTGGSNLGDPDIDVSPLSIAFNEDDPASTNPANITINNNGTRVLSVSETTLAGSVAYSITDGGAPFTVAAGATHLIEVTFGTISVDTEAAILTIESDDPDEAAIQVQLLGGASNTIENTIDQDRTFGDLFADPTEPDYIIDGTISVTSDIRIDPGVTLAFEPGATFTVQTDGSINLVGTADDPIIITSTVETAGSWIGINIFSNNPLNQIRFAEIKFGGNRLGTGQTEEANVYVQTNASLAITDTTIADGRGYGMVVERGAIITEFARNSFARNQKAPLRIPADLIGELDADSTFAGGNTNEYIEVFASSVEDDAQWNAQDVPYRFDGTPTIEADVSIMPGFTAEFESGGALQVDASGSLSAVGTVADPITFTGAVKAPGQWRSINIFGGNPLNELTNCVVAYGGGSLGTGQAQAACVYIQSDGALKITNTRVENCEGFGLAAETNATIGEFAANEFISNGEAAVTIPATLAGMMDGATTFAGANDADWVNIDGTDVTDDATWSALDVAYRFEDNSTSIEAIITIEAGATIAFAVDAGLTIASDGSLTADASGGDPILFTADTEYVDGSGTAGHWRSVNFRSNSAANVLDNVIIEFAGGALGTGQSDKANLYVDSNASATLTNSTVRSSGGWGAFAESSGTLTESGNSFSGNASGGVGPSAP